MDREYLFLFRTKSGLRMDLPYDKANKFKKTNAIFDDCLKFFLAYGKMAMARTGEPVALSQCGKAIEIKAPTAGT